MLWHDWHWAKDTLQRIRATDLESRRWNLLAASASAMIANSGGMGGFDVGKSMEYFQELVDATYSPEEVAARVNSEEAEAEALLEEQRQERARMQRSKRRPKQEVEQDRAQANMARILADRARRGF